MPFFVLANECGEVRAKQPFMDYRHLYDAIRANNVVPNIQPVHEEG
jgi:hypothetical protein